MPSFNESEARRIAGEQPAPVPNDLPAVWSLVIADMQARDQIGRQRYGTPLQPFNCRDALRDAYEEALDLACYLRCAMYERDAKNPPPVADRAAFDAWYSEGGKYPRSVERSSDGTYKLVAANVAWNIWPSAIAGKVGA